MRRGALAVIALVAIAAVIIALVPIRHFGQHHLVIRTSFSDVNGLRAGAPVWLAGVEIGRVRSIQVHTEKKEAPAEVILDVWTDNKIDIPSDAVVTTAQAGILGETLADIQINGTSGAPIRSGDTLCSHSNNTITSEEAIKKFGDMLEKMDPHAQAHSNQAPTKAPKK
jgi:phospholipid/cholesterol/gamma-HCH transport system substrate-binding protein